MALIDKQTHEIDNALFDKEAINQLYKRNATLAAIDMRRNASLPRISESSVYQDSLNSASSTTTITTLQTEQTQNDENESKIEHKRVTVTRKSSFDSSQSFSFKNDSSNDAISNDTTSINTLDLSVETSSTKSNNISSYRQNSSTGLVKNGIEIPLYKPRGVTFSDQTSIYPTSTTTNNTTTLSSSALATNSEFLNQFEQNKINSQQQFLRKQSSKNLPNIMNKFGIGSKNSTNTSNTIDPRQVFLQLFQSPGLLNDKDQIMLIPESNDIQKSIDILDFYPCYMLHKIGVVYIAPGQVR